jgi:restriction endonuclease S subunit/predicted nucleotidyltransferase
MFGLDTTTLNKINSCFEKLPNIEKVILYGSRAKGNYKTGSDIDITLLGDNLTLNNSVYPLQELLDELYIAYKFDISIFIQLDNPKLIEHIQRAGKTLYSKKTELPKGWQVKTLGEVCDIFNGATPSKSKKKYWDNGDINWFTIKDIRNQGRVINNTEQKITQSGFKNSSLKILPINSVLLCCTASIGEFAITKIKLTTNQQFNGLVIKDKNILMPEYLYYFSSTLKNKLLNNSSQTTISFLSLTKLKKISIPIPPLAEQQQIVATLDSLFAYIKQNKEDIKQNIQNTKDLFNSKLEQIFNNKDNNWQEKKLGEVLYIERGGSPRPIQKYLTDDENGLNWIKIADATASDKYIYKTKQKITKEGLHKTKLVKENDFILSNSMSFGKPYIMKTTGCVHDGWLILRDENNKLNQDFLYYLLSSPFVFNQFDNLASGATVRNLNITLVSKVKIPLPSLKEQQTIANNLDKLSNQVQQLGENYQNQLKLVEELEQSVLQKTFNGEF